MARANFVKKSNKDYPQAGIKKGEPYWWWKFRYGGKHYSKTAPKPSQLTQSSFWSQVYSLQERDQPSIENIEDEIECIKGELESIRDECQGSYDNLPENFQNGSAGEKLQSRIEACDEAISNLDGVDTTIDYGNEDDKPTDPDEDELGEMRAKEIWDEVIGHLELSCE